MSKKEGNQTVTDRHGFKMQAPDGKMRKTDCADTEQLFRLSRSHAPAWECIRSLNNG